MQRLMWFIMYIVCLGIQGCASTKDCANMRDCKNTKDLSHKINTALDSRYIYGQGSSQSFDLAKQHAIQDLATNLQVSVKYSMQQNTQQKDNILQTSGLSKTFLESKMKDIPSIEVEKTWKNDGRTYVRVRVDKLILEGAIMNRIQNEQQRLQSILAVCQTPAFSQYKMFKKIFLELQNDIQIYQILTKNMRYGDDIIAGFQNSFARFPDYAIKWDLQNLDGYEDEVRAILVSELSKFITIDSKSKQSLYITTNFDNTFRLFLHFKDCKNNPETTIQIDTHADKKAILQGKQRARFGAIIYKTLEDI